MSDILERTKLDEYAEIRAVMTPEERAELDMLLAWEPPPSWREWIAKHFPNIIHFAPRHIRLWEWFRALQPGVKPSAQVECWPRGGGKSSTVEMACADLSQTCKRRFCLYLCATQDQADLHIQSIAAIMEHIGVSHQVNRFGRATGWRRDQLRTATGFNVAGYGLDTALRGIKIDQYRPDLIVFDDIDSTGDTSAETDRKIRAITDSVLPTGSTDCGILFVQNLMIPDGVVAQLVGNRADFLLDRSVPPPDPAVIGLEYERYYAGDRIQFRITGGTPTWEGQNLETCEAQLNEWGESAFLREAQHEIASHESDAYYPTKFLNALLLEAEAMRPALDDEEFVVGFHYRVIEVGTSGFGGEIHIYEDPVEDVEYTIGGDEAEGHAPDNTHDDSAADGFRNDTREQVLSYTGRPDGEHFARDLSGLSAHYNDARIICERPPLGGTTNNHLKQIGANCYIHQPGPDSTAPELTRYGFPARAKDLRDGALLGLLRLAAGFWELANSSREIENNGRGMTARESAIEVGCPVIRSAVTLRQLLRYCTDHKTGKRAGKRSHDDHNTSTTVATWYMENWTNRFDSDVEHIDEEYWPAYVPAGQRR